MTEEKKEYKQPLKYENGIYIGRDFTKTFDDGTKGYKYKFKRNLDDQYSKNYWGSEKTKGAEKLEEGKEYSIGFVEKDIGQAHPLKSARFFGEPREQDKPKSIEQAAEPKVSGFEEIIVDLPQLYQDYVVEYPESERNSNLFVVYCMMKRQEGVLKAIKDYYKSKQGETTEEEVVN